MMPAPRLGNAMSRFIVLGVLAWTVAACTHPTALSQDPTVAEMSKTHAELLNLPPPQQAPVVAVYGFTDQTGQYKFSENVQTLSRAVTQGATSILIKALQDAGRGTWFEVVERERLDNLLKERQIIREMRAIYEGNNDLNRIYLPPLRFAGVILEGGIISYDTNTLTGGAGAALMGIGGSAEYRQDNVTVYLRAVSTQSGAVLKSVIAKKSIYSAAISFNVFRFVSSDSILEIEAGVTSNEPTYVALKQAIERAVIAMVLEGSIDGMWHFRSAEAAIPLVERHFAQKKEEEFMSVEEYERRKNAELKQNASGNG